MGNLPKFAFLTGEGFTGQKVICLESPYLIASIIDVNRHDEEKVEEYMESMVQGRSPISKVSGYTVFLKFLTCIEPCYDREYQKRIVNEMATFVLQDKILKKPGLFRMSDESGKSEKKFDPAIQKERRLRERRNRSND